MLKLTALALALGSLTVLTSPSSPAAALEGEVLKKSDHKSIGSLIGKWIDAKREKEKSLEALEKLQEKLDKIAKSKRLDSVLSLMPDLRRAFELSEKKGSRSIKSGKLSDVTIDLELQGETVPVSFAVQTPAKFKPAEGPYPLLIVIPGLDDGAQQNAEQHLIENWLLPELRDAAVICALDMPEAQDLWTETMRDGAIGGAGILFTALKELKRACNIDFDYVFLAGWGPGAKTAFQIGHDFPDRFAGVIARAGDVGDIAVENFRNLPTFVAGGGAGATSFEERNRAAGYENCTLSTQGSEEEIWTWMRDHPRASVPQRVTFKPASPRPYKAYWLEVPRGAMEADALIEATIDREANTITVEGRGVSSVRIFFNDDMVNMDLPVKVICNNVEHVNALPRRLDFMLTEYYNGRCDPARLYANAMPYDLQAE